MSGIAVTVESGDLQTIIREVSKLHSEVEGEKIRSEMGFAMWQTIRAHLAALALDNAHHESADSLGATRSGFYERARANTQPPEVEGEGVRVSINQTGFAQRYFGGTISAKHSKYLTIPATAAAYGRRAREFDLRFVLFKKTGLAALIAKGSPEHEGSVYYWLVRSVTQRGDTTIIPEEGEVVDAAKKAAGDYLATVWGSN